MTKVDRVGKLVRAHDRALTVDVRETVTHAAKRMRQHRVGCLVALDAAGKMVGILTERDIVNKVVAQSAHPDKTTVEQILIAKVIFCSWDTPVSQAKEMMAQHEIRHLPIVEDGEPVGMISSRDILAHQLSTVTAVVRRQHKVLQQLEGQYPGITLLQTDGAGRVVI